jgi:hypothetical protein
VARRESPRDSRHRRKAFFPAVQTGDRNQGRRLTQYHALKRWLAAADCVLFHYRAIFTSGAACLARSLGIPILIPRRLDTIDLAEPHPLVFRFDSLDTDFFNALAETLESHPDFDAAAPWRDLTAWPRIAAETARLYRDSTAPAS